MFSAITAGTLLPIPTDYLAVGFDTSPYVAVYSWSSTDGFINRYSNPSTLPTGPVTGVKFTSNADAIIVSHSNSPYVTAYAWSSSGFGSKFSNPATLPTGNAEAVSITESRDAVAIAHDVSPYITAYPWSTSGFGTKFSNPASLPSAICRGCTFNSAGTYLFVTGSNSNTHAYAWSTSGFGTRTTLSGQPFDVYYDIAAAPSGNQVAIAASGSLGNPRILAFPWNSPGFDTKYADPSSPPTGFARGLAFTAAGNALAVAYSGDDSFDPSVRVYAWSSSGFGSKFADPSPLPAQASNAVAFNDADTAIAIACISSSNPLAVYAWSGSGFGSKYANPGTPINSISPVAVDFVAIP